MVQTGCPLGTGTGGESIWGGEFEDEIVPDLKVFNFYPLNFEIHKYFSIKNHSWYPWQMLVLILMAPSSSLPYVPVRGSITR